MLILAYISFISHTWAEHYSGGVYSKQQTSYLHWQPKAIETKKGKRQDTHKIPTSRLHLQSFQNLPQTVLWGNRD